MHQQPNQSSIKKAVLDDSALTPINVNNTINYAISWRDALPQISACCISTSIVIQVGMNMAFSAILLPQLHDKKSDIFIDKSQASWIASIMAISLPFGAIIIGPLVDRFGRKKMCITSLIPFAICWLLHAFATKVWHLYLARILGGFSGGLTTASLIYVSEITHPDYRTMLLSFNSVFVAFGILFIYCIGLWFPWRHIAIINSLIAICSLIGICFIPESPHWHLVFQNSQSQAAKSLKWLYRNESVYEKQFDRILDMTSSSTLSKLRKNSNQSSEDESASLLTKFRTIWQIYRAPTVYKPFALLFCIFVFQQLSGAYVIIFYAVDLFREIGGHFKHGLDEFVALVLLGSIRFVIAIVSSVASKRIGRRVQFLISGLGMCLTSLVAGVYMYLRVIPKEELASLHIDQSDDNVVLYCVLGYVCFSSFGYLVIPWTLTGELLPVKVRGVLSGLMISLAYVFLFGTVKSFPYLLDWIKLQTLFYGLALVNFVGAIFIFFCLPETLGKSFKEIEGYFVRKRQVSF